MGFCGVSSFCGKSKEICQEEKKFRKNRFKTDFCAVFDQNNRAHWFRKKPKIGMVV
jgi:hypothetical protein